jgi:hypothetical protein
VVDKLEADHAAVSDLLNDVESAARAFNGEDGATRQRLVDALQRLATDSARPPAVRGGVDLGHPARLDALAAPGS